ncbi:MAG: FAD:protein FMN transferase [Gammaproteobacteria bacterium]|nr:FAD:protein FMN transferase [Gammaproteobacteria bacterium]
MFRAIVYYFLSSHFLFKITNSFLLVMVCSSVEAAWFRQQQDIMGTRVEVELWHKDPATAQSCSEKVFAEMRRIDAIMSPYKASSEISFINNNAATSIISISAEMAAIIEHSLYFSRLSGGAFDITYASIGYQYDYRKKQQPLKSFIALNLASIDYRHIQLTNQNLHFTDTGVRIDLGGIAKGYAVDRAVSIVHNCGINEAMISAGGDSRILGEKRGKPWIVGIQHPRKPHDLALRLPLSDIAISTSGDYQRYFIRDGQRIHHIINPSTGRPARASWSVTVTGADAMTTDALSTTVFVLGYEKGLALIETLDGIDAIIIDNHGKVHYSSGFRQPDQ